MDNVEVTTDKNTIILEEENAPGLDYHVIASGSKGNAVRIENVMIDCGIAFKRMRDDLYKCDTLLITHAHADHLKPETLESIRLEFPRIRVYANADVAYRVLVDTVVGSQPFKLKKRWTVTPFKCYHDVPCTGYVLQDGELDILYATDTSQIDPMDVRFDYVFLESNYSDDKIRAIGKQYKNGGYNPIESVYRHLSTLQCKEFYYMHRKKKESMLVELHKSSRFY